MANLKDLTVETKDVVEKVKKAKIVDEFKQFIARGNVVDLAVGVIIGGAFGKIVTSLVDNILMPILGILLDGIDFSGLSLTVGQAQIAYGLFIQNVIDFLVVAACIFFIVKALNKFLLKTRQEEADRPKPPTVEEKQLALLQEIRDSLRK